MKRILIAISMAAIAAVVPFTASQSAPDKKPVVYVKKAEITEISDRLAYPARVEPRIKAAVIAEVDGIVSKINTRLGGHVKAKQAIVIVQNTDPVYQYSPMEITSPVEGVVSQVHISEGSRIARGDKLALVTDPHQVRVVVEVTARDLSSIRNGLEASLVVPGQTQSEPVKLIVKGISPFVDPATGTATCELEVARFGQGKKAKLPPPGVISRVSFKANIHHGISLPEAVITYRDSVPHVRKVVNGRAKLTEVRIGRKQEGWVEILSGVKPGDQVIERSNSFVADGDEVEVKEREKKKRQNDDESNSGSEGTEAKQT